MTPPPPFTAASFRSLNYEAAEFLLLEIKERLSLIQGARSWEVVG